MPTFQELGVREDILKGITELGFETPTPIQEKVIAHLLNETNDVVGLAQTGTGKTAAFGIPVLQHLEQKNITQALILAPTRELCIQITRDLNNYAKYCPSIRIVAIYGGQPIEKQISQLRRAPQIIAATPGRLRDMINRKVVNLSQVRHLILDEADEMLNMGFQEELNSILESVPDQRQTLLFSATMPKTVSRIAGKYMNQPTEITVGKKNAGAENVNHIYYMVHARDRYRALKRIVDFHPDIYGIVFCRTRADTKEVSDKLMQDGYSADALHGDLSQAQRDQVMGKFRIRNLQLLVATDVAARGLDVNDLTHVINYQLPDDDEIYTHRSGRTGRANKKGDCVSIAHSRDHSKIRLIENQIGKKFDRRRVPTGQEICQRQLLAIVDNMMEAKVDSERLDPLLEIIYEKVGDMDREAIIRNFVSLEFNRFLSYYKDARDLDVVDGSRRSDRDRNSRNDRGGRDRNRSGGDRDRNRSGGDRNRSGGDRDRNRSGGDRDRNRSGGDRDRNRSGGDRDRNSSSGDRDRGYASGDRDHSDRNRSGESMSRLYINLGTKQGLNPNRLLGMINETVQDRSVRIGEIEVLRSFTFFEVNQRYAANVVKAFEGKYTDDRIKVDMAEGKITPRPTVRKKKPRTDSRNNFQKDNS